MRAALAIVLTALLVACGGGGTIPAPEIRPLPAEYTARKATAYAALWLFITLLIGAFFASLSATWGGRRRDL